MPSSSNTYMIEAWIGGGCTTGNGAALDRLTAGRATEIRSPVDPYNRRSTMVALSFQELLREVEIQHGSTRYEQKVQ